VEDWKYGLQVGVVSIFTYTSILPIVLLEECNISENILAWKWHVSKASRRGENHTIIWNNEWNKDQVTTKSRNYYVPHQVEEFFSRRCNMWRWYLHTKTFTTNQALRGMLVWSDGACMLIPYIIIVIYYCYIIVIVYVSPLFVIVPCLLHIPRRLGHPKSSHICTLLCCKRRFRLRPRLYIYMNWCHLTLYLMILTNH